MSAARRGIVGAAIALMAMTPTVGSAQTWTSWTSATPTSVSGTLDGFGVIYNGIFAAAQLSGTGIDYVNFQPAAYQQNGLTAPTNSGFIQFIGAATGTISFLTPVLNPYIAFISVGQPGLAVTYNFSAPFTVLSHNTGLPAGQCPYWGCGTYTTLGNSITGREFSGVVQFQGVYESITLTTNPGENWHGITVGADQAITTTPEPATMTLLATGLAALAGAKRRKKKQAGDTA